MPSQVQLLGICGPDVWGQARWLVLFSNNLEGDFNRNLFVEVDFGGVLAEFLNGLFEHDDLAVDVVAEFFESFSNLDVVDRAEDGACGGSLGADGESHAFERSCNSFCIGLDLGELVGALTLALFELTQVGVVGNHCFALGDEIVTAVTVLYFNDVVLVAKVRYIFFQYDFHNYVSVMGNGYGFGLFHQVGNEGQESQMACTFNGLCHTTLEFQRGAGDATGKDLALLVEEFLEEFGILVVDIFDAAAFETAVFFLLYVY